MRHRTLAANLSTGPIGLGCMGMSWAYSPSQRDDQSSIELIRSAPEHGVTFLDTADVYGDGHNERLVGGALSGRRDEYVLATKVGLVVDDAETYGMHRDASPKHIRRAAEASLRRLGTDVIDLYYLHRVDPAVPIEESWGAMADLVAEGKVRHVGLSEVTVSQADRLNRLHPVAAIQSELSLWTRDAQGKGSGGRRGMPGQAEDETEPTGDVVGWCAEHGASFVAFSPLGRGFLTGTLTAGEFESGDFRAHNPRFQQEALEANKRISDVVAEVAGRHGVTPAQVALAWVLAQGEHLFAIPGTKNPRYLAENAASGELELTADDLAELDGVPAAVGSRY
jgi:aryl-alcohol dehydrogenase-like predicted oxidoreductase